MRRILRGLIVAVLVALVPAKGSSTPAASARSSVRVAYTAYDKKGNVLIMDASGVFLTPVTTRAGKAIAYPYYSWSPDGKYLLLVRARSLAQGEAWDLLLMNTNGDLVRTLVSGAPAAFLFPPSWAVDGDEVAYVATMTPSSGGLTHNVVNRIDLQGHASQLFQYDSKSFYENNGPPPSDAQFETEVGLGMTAPSSQWSIAGPIVVYGTAFGPGLALLNLHAGKLFVASKASEASLSSTGMLALVNAGSVVLVNTATGGVIRTVAPGELPSWSPDGHTLYFERRMPGKSLTFHAVIGTLTSTFPTYTSAIWRVGADGSGLKMLTSQDAFGFGPLRALVDGSLIFSRVDNSVELWRHQPVGADPYPADLWQRYAPKVQIQRLAADGTLVTLAHNAGKPAVQR